MCTLIKFTEEGKYPQAWEQGLIDDITTARWVEKSEKRMKMGSVLFL